VASSCTGGVETACQTGTPAVDDATCDGIDDDCDGTADEDYLSDESCFLPGACSASNVGSTCDGGIETTCQTGTPALDDATCDGIDDDCDGTADEDYAPDSSCFLPGACSPGNAPSSCVGGVETTCQTGTPALDDATCDGVDDDCDGTADEDYLSDESCFLPGACFASNAGSTCVGGVETACQTGTPALDDATCDGIDDDCDGAPD
jgi:hypothetical protein